MKDICVYISFLLLSSNAFTQSLETLKQCYAIGDYDCCIDEADAILSKKSNELTAHFIKASALIKTKEYKEALHHIDLAEKNDFKPAFILNIEKLRSYAGLQENEKLIALLTKMTENGFSGIRILNEDEFQYLNSHVEFESLRAVISKNANPCKYDDKFQKLDFWLGEWEVFVNGIKQANSWITKSKNGCILYEDYQAETDYSGNSINYYDPLDGLYKQSWIDKFNKRTDFIEIEAHEGYLLYQSGKGDSISHMSYTLNKDQTVTQSWESSLDGGKNWTNIFKGIYKPKPKKQTK